MVKSDRIKAQSDFITDADSWIILSASSQSALWSATSTGSLNHYIYSDTISLVVGSLNTMRWAFKAPSSPFDDDFGLAYNGALRFVLGAFAGDFSEAQYALPRRFVEIECSTCDSGNGVILVQRDVVYSGAIQQFEFPLNLSSTWVTDPKDNRASAVWSAPTQCDIFDVLSGLTALRIYGDLTTGYEAIGLDA
eukprot:950102_1